MDIIGFLSAAWQAGVQNIIAVFFGSLGLVSWWTGRQTREITYTLSRWPAARIYNDLLGHLTITMDGEPVAEVEMFSLEVRNSGRADLKAEDWLQPLRIAFGPQSWVSAHSDDCLSEPSGIVAPLGREDHAVVVQPVALTHGDVLRYSVAVQNPDLHVEVTGRVLGVRELRAKSEWDRPPMPLSLRLIFLALYPMTAWGVDYILTVTKASSWDKVGLVLLGMILLLVMQCTALVLRPIVGLQWARLVRSWRTRHQARQLVR
jgi:hypothetical protein